MKTQLAIASLALALIVTGCGTVKSIITPAVARSGASAAVSGVALMPQAKPYVLASLDVMCSVANGTNLAPENVVKAINASPIANAAKTEQGVLVVKALVLVYNLAWNSFGAPYVADSELRPYLQAVCDGGHDGLPSASVARRLEAIQAVDSKWPNVQWP